MLRVSDLGYIIDPDVWLTPFQAAKKYGCSLQTLYNKMHKGVLPEEYLLIDTDSNKWYLHKDTPYNRIVLKPRRNSIKGTKHTQE